MAPKFKRTYTAAQVELGSTWELIEAIADDAVANDLPITGAVSLEATRAACDAAGLELADATLHGYALVAKFDYEANARQRRVFRRYGPSIVRELAGAGWDHEDAAQFLMGERKSYRDVHAAIAERRPLVPRSTSAAASPSSAPAANVSARPAARPNLADRWLAWAADMNRVMMRGTELAAETDAAHVELDGEAAFAQLIYERITERKIDAELRELLSADAR